MSSGWSHWLLSSPHGAHALQPAAVRHNRRVRAAAATQPQQPCLVPAFDFVTHQPLLSEPHHGPYHALVWLRQRRNVLARIRRGGGINNSARQCSHCICCTPRVHVARRHLSSHIPFSHLSPPRESHTCTPAAPSYLTAVPELCSIASGRRAGRDHPLPPSLTHDLLEELAQTATYEVL